MNQCLYLLLVLHRNLVWSLPLHIVYSVHVTVRLTSMALKQGTAHPGNMQSLRDQHSIHGRIEGQNNFPSKRSTDQCLEVAASNRTGTIRHENHSDRSMFEFQEDHCRKHGIQAGTPMLSSSISGDRYSGMKWHSPNEIP
jgi:hypothetical protein